jgi:hypothetical protein
MIYVTCSQQNIYRNNSWYGDPLIISGELECRSSILLPEVVAEIYPPFEINHVEPHILGGAEEDLAEVAFAARSVNDHFRRGQASVLMKLESACLSRAVVYTMGGQSVAAVYETHRLKDRNSPELQNEGEMRLVDQYFRADPFYAYFWVGSTQSKSYSQWLALDLPELRGLTEIRRLRPYAYIVVVTPDCGEIINKVHIDTITAIAVACDIENIKIMTVNLEARYFFEELYFATPTVNSFGLKSPDAVSFVADTITQSIETLGQNTRSIETGKSIFLLHNKKRERNLANQEDIKDAIVNSGFITVECESLSFMEQVILFSQADCVVGSMGHAMAATLFCRPGSMICYLAPEGLTETFYWDLAAIRQHRYAACYGFSAGRGIEPERRNYRINPRDVAAAISWLKSAPQAPEVTEIQPLDPFRF